MATQTESGKAFEYALMNAATAFLSSRCNVAPSHNAAFIYAASCFEKFPITEQQKMLSAGNAAISHITSLEPKLTSSLSENDILQIQLMPDHSGKTGDVRDVFFSRPSQNWEIGISAKNNHKAVKHSRLSDVNNFANAWMGYDCSENYFQAIRPVFHELRTLKDQGAKWRELPAKHVRFYVPVLDAFRNEITRLNSIFEDIPANLVTYLLGTNDFYKVMRSKNVCQVLAFNMHNTLNHRSASKNPALKIPRLSLPTQIVQFEMKPKSTDTLILTCDHGWQISFRIHNAETLVVPSLKFDVNLVGHPQNIYSNHIVC